jgi:hypothetical protein
MTFHALRGVQNFRSFGSSSLQDRVLDKVDRA